MTQDDSNVTPLDGYASDAYAQFQGMKILFDETVGLFPAQVVEVEKVGESHD